jgi:hypothetical protein
MIELEHKKLRDLILLKDEIVTEGRKLTGEIEKVEREVRVFEEKEKKITGKVEPNADLKAEGDELVIVFEKTLKRLEYIGKAIEKEKLRAIPEDMKLAHKALLKKIEELERERNKKALKVQKIKDRIIPLVQAEVKPLLKEYDDIETAQVKGDKVVITTFNHLNDWMRKFKSRG